MPNEQVNQQVELLRQQGHNLDVVEADGWINIILHAHPLPQGYNRQATEVLIKLPLAFPNGRPDMFWTEPELRLQDGRTPRNADPIETAMGKQWRRFSYHPSSWNPGTDDLATYIEFVNAGLHKARQI